MLDCSNLIILNYLAFDGAVMFYEFIMFIIVSINSYLNLKL
jgi:hypothetical protein